MLFNSLAFFVFLLVTFVIYYLPLPVVRRNREMILILASFFFYGFLKPVILLLLVFSVAMNTCFSYLIAKTSRERIPAILVPGIIFNVALLAFFKYSPLIGYTLSGGQAGISPVFDFLLTIPLPIGISFYTFEGISLLIDLSKGKAQLDLRTHSFSEHFKKTALFISFFPHLIAGPILKAREFYPQIDEKFFKNIPWEEAAKKIILGYFLKMVVGDNLNQETAGIAFPYFQGVQSYNLLLLLFGYSMQIFADFAGYSLIAIGLGLLFGYRLPDNFNFPYISASFSEFWRRWHISLSTWLRDYLYIPLGGNKKGEWRTYLNLFLVMLLGGLWHGASWSYAAWGGLHGILLMVERFFRKDGIKSAGRDFLGMIVVFCLVTILWLFFKLPNFEHFLAFFKAVAQNQALPFKFGKSQLGIIFYALPVIFYHIAYLVRDSAIVKRVHGDFGFLLYGLLLFLILVNSGPQGAFIYFQF